MVVNEKDETPAITTEDNITFDISAIQAKEIDYNKFSVVYPTVGEIGIVSKDGMTEENIKKLCALSAEWYGLKPVFAGEFKVNYKTDEDFEQIKSSDKMFEAQKEMKNFVKENNAEKEKDKFLSLRENLINSIELKAQNIIKSHTSSFKTGITKIVATDSMLEYVNNKFDGKIFVKAIVGKDIISYGLPVIKNNITIKGGLELYKEKREAYVDEVSKKIEQEISASIEKDCEFAKIDFENEQKERIEKILAFKVSDMQKRILMDKNFLPAGVENGQILNLKGTNYKVEFEENGIMCNLILVQ
jgi:hypothetical protein